MASPPPYQMSEQTIPNVDNEVVLPDASPPPYPSSDMTEEEDFAERPPAYNDVVKPPTYDEVEAMHRHSALREMFNLSEDDFDLQDRSVSRNFPMEIENSELSTGSDYAFIACFFLSFILNWIGLLVGYCLGQSHASQYGSISGFGLSLIKWAFLIKHSNCCVTTLREHSWLIWLFVIAGWVMFLKGSMSYARLKRGGHRSRLCII